MVPAWTGLDPELEAIFNDDEPDGPELPRKKVPIGDVYEASRAGDVERLQFLLELGVNVNARDAWDSVALYYACLAGHLDAAHMLLKNGAICSENTFDGDRCHYAALNLRVRKLLKAWEARPPPLSPLPSALRELFISSHANLTYLEGTMEIHKDSDSTTGLQDHRLHSAAESNDGPDVTFFVSGRPMQAHRAILAARSPYFKEKFETDWKHRREFSFSSSKLSFSALFCLLQFFYSDRLDVAVDDMEDLLRICKVCKCMALQKAISKEQNHQRFASYKSVKDVDDSKKRFIIQASSFSWQFQLPAAMRRLLRRTYANSRIEKSKFERALGKETLGTKGLTDKAEEHDVKCPTDEWSAPGQNRHSLLNDHLVGIEEFEEDHADVIFLVDGERFRCHSAILGIRSEYFKARFHRALEDEFETAGITNLEHRSGELPTLTEHDMSAYTFKKLLEYIYTDTVEEIDPDEAEGMFDAASRYLVFSLKRAVVDVLLRHLESTTPAELCHWLLLADMYDVSKLREYCLDAIALNFELFAATSEFRSMLRSLPPPSSEDATRTSAPSAPGGDGIVEGANLLDDLREKWIAIEGEELDQRDQSARKFDQRLKQLAEESLEESAIDKCQDLSTSDTHHKCQSCAFHQNDCKN